MRITLFSLLICISLFTNGQKVSKVYNQPLIPNYFAESSDNWPQRYTSSELTVIENGKYRIKRTDPKNPAFIFANGAQKTDAFSFSAQIEVKKGEIKSPSGGIVAFAQADGSNALIVEINRDRKFRIFTFNGVKRTYLSGSAKAENWVKTKTLKKGETNLVTIKSGDKWLDLYFNNTYLLSLTLPNLKAGNFGFYVSPESEILVHQVVLHGEFVKPKKEESTETEGDDMSEVIQLFRDKIEKQADEIQKLELELRRCKSQNTTDSIARNENVELKQKIAELEKQHDEESAELQKLRKRAGYLELIKEQIEESPDGDLLIKITQMLEAEKKAKKKLSEKNKELMQINFLLLQQVEELKKQLGTDNSEQ